MNLEKASEFSNKQQVINDSRDALVEEMTNYTPEQAVSAELTPIERFNDLWQRGMGLLCRQEGDGGIIELRGNTETGVPLKINLTLTGHEDTVGRYRQKIEASWSGGSPYAEIGKPEFVNNDLAEYWPEEQRTLEGLALLEQSMTAAEELAEQMRSGEIKPSVIWFASAKPRIFC